MEQIRAAEYRARQFANQQLTDSKTASAQQAGDSQQSVASSISAPAQNQAVLVGSQGASYAMHGSPLPPQGPQVSGIGHESIFFFKAPSMCLPICLSFSLSISLRNLW